MRPGLLLLTCVCGMSAWVVPALAGTTQAAFAVQIQLSNPALSGYCINQTLSQSTRAVVTVVCASNQFVSIEPQPGKSFLGTDGAAYRFMFEPTALISADDPLWYIGAGTITAMHVSHGDGPEHTMELLVSF